MSIKAIETRYKGYRFRSRLEARWGVFFDSLNIQFEYESEGYKVDNECYLPDFKIFSAKFAFVVHGPSLEQRLQTLTDQCLVDSVMNHHFSEFDNQLFPNVKIMAIDDVFTAYLEIKPSGVDPSRSDFKKIVTFSSSVAPSCMLVAFGEPLLMNLIWISSERQGDVSLAPFRIIGVRGGCIFLLGTGAGCDDVLLNSVFSKIHSREVLDAAVAARSARFEHGESGAR